FAKVMGSLLSSKIGSVIQTKSDAYRVIFKIPEYFGNDLIIDCLNELNENWVETILFKSIKNTTLFEYRFFQVAKRFGIISKNAEYSSLTVSRLIKIYKDTPIFEEALKELLREKLDLEGCKEIIKKIHDGKIKIKVSADYTTSPLGVAGLDYSAISLVRPEEKISEVYEMIKERLLKKQFWFACMNCGAEIGRFKNSNIPSNLKCKKCGARLIGFAPIRDQIMIKKILKKHFSGGELNKEEKEFLKRFSETAELFLNYGKKACFVLAGYGIGPQVAKRILGKYLKDEKELLKEIIKAERNFIATRKFWSV
ncbi:MAG: hypothetical protein J7L39_03770, partial [Candidatus Aenigmarchaeota archaeon]|nr:hypothetical protein [Candidatus Aenigmarchaeota archaeon]